ncbi:DinB family protein [compost metagenome]
MIEANILREKLQRSFGLYDDFIQELKEENLQLDLKGLPSNTIGQQLWCVIGARQSYLNAILSDGWQGFACALDWKSTGDKSAVQQQLADSKNAFLSAVQDMASLTSKQQSLMFDLIEHEAQHHGQLVRYLYGLKLSVPATWKKRYNLD